jgi:hypothetical protein
MSSARRLGPGLSHWEAPHPQWEPTEPWSEIEREKLTVTEGAVSFLVIGDADAHHAMHCAECGSLIYWTARSGTHVRVTYATLIDEPALKPTVHIFVGSKAPWSENLDDLPQHDE